MSRSVIFKSFGGPEVLQFIEQPVDEPGPGDVRIRVEAFSVNPLDLMARSGRSPAPVTLPARVGIEATGVVDAVGEGVSTLGVGDAVITTAIPDAALNGAHAEHLVLRAERVIARPAELGVAEAAAVWVGFSTAYGALVEKAGMRAGDRVLITAPSGSVGRAALQIAAYLGATPIALTRRPDAEAELRAAGTEAVVTRSEDLAGLDVDIVLDLVAGPGLNDVLAATRPGATVVVAGFLDPRPSDLPVAPVTIHRYMSFEHVLDPLVVRRMSAVLNAGVQHGAFRPAIGKEFTFEAVADAHRHAESRGGDGKTVVVL